MDRKAVPWFRHQNTRAPCSFGNQPCNMISNIYFDKKRLSKTILSSSNLMLTFCSGIRFSLENRHRTSSQLWCRQSALFSKTPGVKPDRETTSRTSSGRPLKLNQVPQTRRRKWSDQSVNCWTNEKSSAQMSGHAVRAATTSSRNRSWALMLHLCKCGKSSKAPAAFKGTDSAPWNPSSKELQPAKEAFLSSRWSWQSNFPFLHKDALTEDSLSFVTNWRGWIVSSCLARTKVTSTPAASQHASCRISFYLNMLGQPLRQRWHQSTWQF